MTFVHTQGHSTYSFLEGLWSPKKLAAKAKEMGMDALALTDYYGMYGCIDFYLACKDVWIKPLIGVELPLSFDVSSPLKQQSFVTLLAQNNIGYKNLLKLTSLAATHGRHEQIQIDVSQLQHHHEGIIIILGWSNSVLYNLGEQQAQDILTKIMWWTSPLYINLIAQTREHKANTFFLNLAQQHSLPCLLNTNYHYIEASDKEAYVAALAIKDGKKLYDQDKRTVNGDHHLHSPHEITQHAQNFFADHDRQSWIDNSASLAASCEIDIPLRQTLFPNYETPSEIASLYDKHKDALIQE